MTPPARASSSRGGLGVWFGIGAVGVLLALATVVLVLRR
jgi:hypothetical protein